jgi:hypothetical protein
VRLDDDSWSTAAVKRTIDKMRSLHLTMTAVRDKRDGHLKYILSNGDLVHPSTAKLMKDHGLLVLDDPDVPGQVVYSLRKTL